jgi:CHAT domain-containing protein
VFRLGRVVAEFGVPADKKRRASSATERVSIAFFRRCLLRGQTFILIVLLLLPLVVCGDSRFQGPLALLTRADRLALLYNWPEAARGYTEAESLFAQSGDAKNALAARLGHIWSTADGGVSPAINREIDAYLESPLVESDSRLMLRALIAKAALDQNTNELAARKPWEQILNLAKSLGDERWQQRAKAELGQILYFDGDVQSATTMLREAIVSQYVRLDLGAAIHYTAMVGNGFIEAGRPETGLQYCDTALKAAFFVGDLGFPFLAYQGKARALIALHRDAEAQKVLNDGLQRARTDANYSALAQLLIVAGTAAESYDQSRAVRYLVEATNVSEAKGFRHVFAWSSFELASVYRDTGNLDGAELLASRAIAAMRDIEDRYHLPQHLSLLADLAARKGQVERADELYSEAEDVIDGLLVNVNQRQLKAELISTLSKTYLGHFELTATKFFSPARAYEVIEQARGRSLADTLRGQSESLSGASEMSLDAQREINRIQLALLGQTNRDGRQSLLDELFRAEQFLSPARRNVSLLNSATNRLKPIPLSTLEDSLESNEMLLEYVLGETESYCLRITRSATSIIVIPRSGKAIEKLVDDYLTAVRSRQPEVKPAADLYSVLLEPVIGQEAPKRLIIVPDGKLHLLPFDGLLDQNGKYVLESHIVTYAPSATVLHLLRNSHSRDKVAMSFLGVGDVIYPRSAVVTANASGRTTMKQSATADFFDVEGVTFPELPGSRQEIVSVAGIMPGEKRVLLDKDATEAEFKALPLADFRVIHLAVHGLGNSQFPDRAALILGSSPTIGQDGLLQVREIRDLPLRADLVTLSACDTGNGKLLGEEGIASLERAFLLAGAKSVIASLWTADDTYTIALMKRLYKHLIDGYDKGAALQQAKVDLLKEFAGQAAPVYWAGFILVGEGSASIFN